VSGNVYIEYGIFGIHTIRIIIHKNKNK